MMNTTTTTNTTNNSEKFYADFGKLIAEYMSKDSDFLNKLLFKVEPDVAGKTEEAPEVKPEPQEDPKKTAQFKMRQFGKHGITAVNPTSNRGTKINEERLEVLKSILEKHPEVQLNDGMGRKQGHFNCPMHAVWIIGHYDPEGKLIDDALSLLIASRQHLADYGITSVKLELVTRILALHQRRGAKKVKELLTKILTDQTMNSLLVLAKETHLYTQRSAIDQRVMWVEAELAKEDGIRNQFEVGGIDEPAA